MICTLDDGELLVDDLTELELLENLAIDDIKSCAIKGNLASLRAIIEFRDKKYVIKHSNKHITAAPYDALNYFKQTTRAEWDDLIEMVAYLGYQSLLYLLLLIGRVRKYHM